MFTITVVTPGGAEESVQCALDSAVVGKAPDCLVQLHGWKVANRHLVVRREEQGLFIEDQGSAVGTFVNGARVSRHGPLTPSDEIEVGGYRLFLRAAEQENDLIPDAPVAAALDAPPLPARAAGYLPQPSDEGFDPAVGELLRWSETVRRRLLQAMDLKRIDVGAMSEAELRNSSWRQIEEIISTLEDLPSGIDRTRLGKLVLDEVVGLGPLEELLADDAVSEIMVNRHDEVFIERGGRLERSPTCFSSSQSVLQVIDRIVAPLGRRIDESSPMVDARLPDGSRVNAVIPPLALRGPSITIRKFSRQRLTVEDLMRFGAVSDPMVKFLELAVLRRKSIVVSGGTGSGKTTLLNVLSNFIPKDERIITIEDAAELRLNQSNLVSLEARPPNIEGKGVVTIRDLVRNSLRMRPDRIVVGECRGGEALDMLQAMNTGHDGSLTTVHANSPRDALSRIEVMVLMAGVELPVAAIREQIAAGVHLIVQQTRFACGSRKITHISELTGVESGTIQLQDIFTFRQHGYGADGRVQGEFGPTGAIPEFYEQLRARGIPTDLSIFRTAGAP